jgi:hypothetical protein
MGRLLPAVKLLSVLLNHVDDIIEPFGEDLARPLNDHLFPVHS